MNKITEDMSVAEIVKSCPDARRVFDRHGLKGCGGEHGPSEPLAFFAAVHQVDVDELVREINDEMESSSNQPYVYKETLPDYIYRRFFKAGVLTVLTVGCLVGRHQPATDRVGTELSPIAPAALYPCPRARDDLRLGGHVRHGFRLPVVSPL